MDEKSPLEQLRRHLLVGLGAASLLGCGASQADAGESEGGVTTTPSSSASGSGSEQGEDEGGESSAESETSTSGEPSPGTTGPSSTTSTDTDTDSDSDSDTSPMFDLGTPDLPPLGECLVTETGESTLEQFPDCPITLGDELCFTSLYWGCVEAEPGQSCDELCPDGDCIADWTNCEGDPVGEQIVEVCGPYAIDGQCCSLAEIEEFCGTDGRPFIIEGQPRLAKLEGCAAAGPSELRTHWEHAAQAEHASIASFAQFSLRLLALGAPAALVREAIAAAADEVSHANFALGLAGELTHSELRFRALDTRGAAQTQTLEQTLVACVREGCIGETLAALELRYAALACDNAKLAAALEAVAADEQRHASLAWRFAQWALSQAPELREAVAEVFDALEHTIQPTEPSAQPPSSLQLAELHRHGCLSAAERTRVRQAAITELLRPCAEALLA